MATKRDNKPGQPAILSVLWRRFRRDMFDTYRPELHYMRGPGPKWREKHQVAARPAELPDATPAHI